MEKFERFLNSIYQATCTAVQSIDDIMPAIKDSELKEVITTQNSKYLVIQNECKAIAKAENIDIKGNDFFEKAKLWTSIKISTAFDKTARNISEMMMLGTYMGIIQNYKDQYDYSDVSPELTELSLKLSNLEMENLKELKPFLAKNDQ